MIARSSDRFSQVVINVYGGLLPCAETFSPALRINISLSSDLDQI
jgi:hypothetical protein